VAPASIKAAPKAASLIKAEEVDRSLSSAKQGRWPRSRNPSVCRPTVWPSSEQETDPGIPAQKTQQKTPATMLATSRLSTPLAARAQSHARELSRALTGVSRPLVPSDAQQQQQQRNNVCRSVQLQRSTAVQIRQRHSQTQVKRLFKNHPARARVFNRLGMEKRPGVIPDRKYPAVFEPEAVLPNGWSSPPAADFQLPQYPFHVPRTAGKVGGAAGFLPVYSDCRVHGTKYTTIIRKVTGDQDAFLSELRAVLHLDPRDDDIRIRAGGTIEINGNRVREVKEWLGGLGF